MKILLVDDEPDLLELINYTLSKEGYQISTAENGVEAVEIAKKLKPDLILMDVMMPKMDGIEACVAIREEKSLEKTIIALLTARGEDYSQIAAFESGADDFITKPIKPRVLVSKVKALLRRSRTTSNESPDNQDLIRIDRDKYVVVLEGKELSLPKKEFELLALLLSKPGIVFTREEILFTVWEKDVFVGDRTIDVHIRKLREKIGINLIKTVKGIGYKTNLPS